MPDRVVNFWMKLVLDSIVPSEGWEPMDYQQQSGKGAGVRASGGRARGNAVRVQYLHPGWRGRASNGGSRWGKGRPSRCSFVFLDWKSFLIGAESTFSS